MKESTEIRCQICNQLLFYNYENLSMEIKCPRCKAKFLILISDNFTIMNRVKCPTVKYIELYRKKQKQNTL